MPKNNCSWRNARPRLALVLGAAIAAAWFLPAMRPALATTVRAASAAIPAPAGVPLPELVPGSPERYVVQPGDTLRSVAARYLRAPWRWPQLWGPAEPGSALPPIRPGHVLVLERQADRARLRIDVPAEGDPLPTQRLSPRMRVQLLAAPALPTLEPHLIEPFLAEPLIVDEETFRQAPRIVVAREGRVLITRGDPAYARGPAGSLLEAGVGTAMRVFRGARPVRDPVHGTVLGLEAQYVGRALLLRPQGHPGHAPSGTPPEAAPVPALIEIVAAREEIRAGDRLLPEPPRAFLSYAPRAPQQALHEARVAALYGDAVSMAGQNQVVVINKGSADGLASGHVLALVQRGLSVTDRTVPGLPEQLQLPDERNGLVMVFRTFERLSYALVLETSDGVQVGDRVVTPE